MLPLVFLGVAYAALYTLLSWQRFATFHSQIDMSYYLRQVWGLGHGHYDLPLVKAQNILGLHLEPILGPLALLGRLGIPLPPLLLSLQAAAVALIVWPAYRLGERHLGGACGSESGSRRFYGLCGAALALLYPTVTVATLHDFHPVTLALAPLFFTIDALDEGRLRRALVFGGLALLCREDIALQLFCLFLAYALPGGRLGRALSSRTSKVAFTGLLLFLLVYFFGYVLWVQPRFVPSTGSYTLHFAKLGAGSGGNVHSGRDLMLSLLSHPRALFELLLTGERLRYPLLLLSPLLLLPLFSPRTLAGALPVLGINFLSSFPGVLRLESHYTTALVPFVVGAGLIGAGRLRAYLSPRLLALLLLCAVVTAHVFCGGSPLALRSDRFAWRLFIAEQNAGALRQAVAGVPRQASVAARPGVLAHLCERPRALSPPEYDDGHPVDVTLSGE